VKRTRKRMPWNETGGIYQKSSLFNIGSKPGECLIWYYDCLGYEASYNLLFLVLKKLLLLNFLCTLALMYLDPEYKYSAILSTVNA
jgi:hypothetical protein